MNFTRRQARATHSPQRSQHRMARSIVLGLTGIITLVSTPGADAAVAKQSTEVVIAKLDKACAVADRYASKSSSTTYNAVREFKRIVQLFTAYGTALKSINPASPAEAAAMKQLRNFVSFGKAESSVILKLMSNKKTVVAGSDRTLTFLTTAEALAKTVRSTFREVSLPPCDEMLVGDDSSDFEKTDTTPTAPPTTDPTAVGAGSIVDAILNQSSAPNGRQEVAELNFPPLAGLRYRTTPEYEGVANQLYGLTKSVYGAVSVRQIVDSVNAQFCLIAVFQILPSIDQPTRTRVVNVAAASLDAKEGASVNGYRVFIGGTAQFDKAILARSDVFFEITFPPTSDRTAISKFVADFVLKLPAA